MQKFTDKDGKTRTAEEVLAIFNRGAEELHGSEDGNRRVGRTLAQSIEEGRWLGEGFDTSRLQHHPTWLGGNRDLRITDDGGRHLWLRWDDGENRYRILEGGRPMPAYTGGRTVMDLPQTEAEFLRLEEESRRRP